MSVATTTAVIGLYLLYCGLWLTTTTTAFNLEVSLPVIKLGRSESYFGYSVAQHRTLRTPEFGQSLLLVGAPRDDNLQPNTSRSGALWQCKLSSDLQDCSQVPVDGKRSLQRGESYGVYDGHLTELNPPVSSEIKNGQWLGVEVKSQGEGGKVIVCAHRYAVRNILKPRDFNRKNETQRGMLGLCYVLDSSLQVLEADSMGYKSVVVIRDALSGKRQEPRPNFDNHMRWGMCQLGTSATFVSDQLDEDVALFGAPGCFTWRGNVFSQQVGTFNRYSTAVNSDTFKDYDKNDLMGMAVTSIKVQNKLYYVSGAPHAEPSGQVYFFTHNGITMEPHDDLTLYGEDYGAGFGLSLATCDINGDGNKDLIVGAPFFDNQKNYANRGGAVFVYLSTPNNHKHGRGRHHLKLNLKIIGRELLSQFGSAITCLGDMNKDGFEDFAVGAPYEAKSSGAVYIFFGQELSKPAILNAEEVAEQVITAADIIKEESVANALLPPLQHSQEALTLTTFGSSLSGGQDMDKNGYPDLAVGAYASSAVFLFRARPIIDILTYVDDKNLHGINPGQTGCTEDPNSEDACFSFNACFQVSSEATQYSHSLTFLIEAEPQKAMPRVYLKLAENMAGSYHGAKEATKNSSVEGIVQIVAKDDDQQCIKVIGYVGNAHTDLQTPVQFQISYSLVQNRPKMRYNQGDSLPTLDNYPILNQAEAKKKFQATFEKDCGEDDVCKTDFVISTTLRDNAKELGRTPTGEAYELELGSLEGNELVLDIQIVNKLEPAYEAILDVFFPNALQYIGVGNTKNAEDDISEANNSDNNDASAAASGEVVRAEMKNSTWLSLSLGNPFKSSAVVKLRFKPRPDMQEKIIVFYLSANTTSTLLNDASTFVSLAIVRRAEVKLMGVGFPEQLHFGGPVLGEYDFSDLGQVGPPLVHKFLVINNGPSMLDVLSLHIQWPYQVENGHKSGKWLFYLSQHPSLRNGRGVCYLPPGIMANPLNLTSKTPEKYGYYGRGLVKRNKILINGPPPTNILHPDDDTLNDIMADEPVLSRRPKRVAESHLEQVWVEKVVAPRTIKNYEGRGRDLQVITLDCDRGTAKCLDIRCDVYNLPVRVPATVEIRARLWNSTLMEDYGSGIDFVEIFAKAEVKLDGDISQYVGDDFMSVKTLVYADIARQRPRLFPDWWIILISVLVGLLVLFIISSILHRLGFFKRKRPNVEEDDSDLMMSAHFEKVRLNSDY